MSLISHKLFDTKLSAGLALLCVASSTPAYASNGVLDFIPPSADELSMLNTTAFICLALAAFLLLRHKTRE
jgi:predicted transporter